MSFRSKSDGNITNITEALDVEELERRLELATQSSCCDCCGQHATGCEQLECAVDPMSVAKPPDPVNC